MCHSDDMRKEEKVKGQKKIKKKKRKKRQDDQSYHKNFGQQRDISPSSSRHDIKETDPVLTLHSGQIIGTLCRRVPRGGGRVCVRYILAADGTMSAPFLGIVGGHGTRTTVGHWGGGCQRSCRRRRQGGTAGREGGRGIRREGQVGSREGRGGRGTG